MGPGRLIGALLGLVCAASCVSILGVDAEEYEDIDETICSCVKGGPAVKGACEEIVQRLVEGEAALQAAKTCATESATCSEMEDCLVGGACLALEEPCVAPDGDFQLRCCDDTECFDGKCSPPCSAPRVPCGEACCDEGDTCEDGACRAPCVDVGDFCDVEGAGPCCSGSPCRDDGTCPAD